MDAISTSPGPRGIIMKETDKAYIAGFIDADGSISIVKDKNGYAPRVTIANCDFEVLLSIQEQFGGSGCISTKKPRKKNHRPSHDLAWVYNVAIEVVTTCYPYFRLKKPRADCLLKWKSVVKRNGKYTKEELSIRDSLVGKMRELNKRGV